MTRLSSCNTNTREGLWYEAAHEELRLVLSRSFGMGQVPLSWLPAQTLYSKSLLGNPGPEYDQEESPAGHGNWKQR